MSLQWDEKRESWVNHPAWSAIEERWEQRVLKNKWEHDPAGGDKYLKKYGKQIGIFKLRMLYKYAKDHDALEFAIGIKKQLDFMELTESLGAGLNKQPEDTWR